MSKQKTSGGVGFLGLLTIVFIVLKLIENPIVSKWSWWAVLSPLWLPIVLVIAIMIVWGIFIFIFDTYK